ncbi:ATP-binding cassette, putative [Eimeria praecox]|uniref:ATP-binding cassette, putative n=1 Tax=Eimeria praecox TaxID=51316 RepID=U6GQ49_9EIME|nr:ATP-binding cassette, putative [Eimeria praecox]
MILLKGLEEEKQMGAPQGGTQLLLPLAVGKLIDAAAQTPGQQQQQQQHLQQQQQQQQDEQQSKQVFEDSLHDPEAPREASPATAASATAAAAAAAASETTAATAATAAAAGERSSWGSLKGYIEDRLQTPEARLGFCVALGVVGAATSFARLFLLESTTTSSSQQQQLGALAKHLSQDVVTASRVLVDISFGLRCLLTSVVGEAYV